MKKLNFQPLAAKIFTVHIVAAQNMQRLRAAQRAPSRDASSGQRLSALATIGRPRGEQLVLVLTYHHNHRLLKPYTQHNLMQLAHTK